MKITDFLLTRFSRIATKVDSIAKNHVSHGLKLS